MVEKDSRRTVKLADNDPFRAIHDEGAVFGHQRDLAEIDLLLLDVANRFGFRIPIGVENDEADHDLKRGRIRHPLLNALLLVVADIANLITDKLEGTFPTEIGNGEDAVEGAQQTIVPPLVRIDILLKKLSIGIGLNIDQVWNIQYLPDTTKILSKFAHNILSAFCRQRS